MNTPVVLLIFRRPQMTERVVRALSVVKPRKLLVVADGPRPDRPGEPDACRAAREVIERIDWDCEILRNYSEVNLGCGLRPASGISWAFEQVEEAIILEDDCVPHPTFFPFCSELLQRYRDDERVMHIAGSTLSRAPVPTAFSYTFSRFNVAWGWATWRRAWRHFDQTLQTWPTLRDTSWLLDLLKEREAVEYWSREFQRAYDARGNVSYWDHQWTFACWANSGLSIAPRANLVSNIGCGPDATHTFREDDQVANIPVVDMTFPLVHPVHVLPHHDWDRQLLREVILARLHEPSVSRLRVVASRVAPEFVKRQYRQVAATIRAIVAHSIR
jgi:hypothetical protein